MTVRVGWKPSGCAVSVPFHELGQAAGGAWGLVEDAAWMAPSGAGRLELLYKSQADYSHAMRRLPAPEIALAVQHRRKTFWKQIEEESTSLMQSAIWDCISRTGNDEAGFRARGKLVSLHASFIHVPMFASLHPNEWPSKLVDEESELVAELESASLRPVGIRESATAECAARRRFGKELGGLMSLGAGLPPYWPYQEVQRVYAVEPVTPRLQPWTRSEGEGNTSVEWRDRLLIPLLERDADRLGSLGFRLQPVLATRGELIAAAYLLTPAQLDVEIDERLSAPDFRDHLRGLRIAMASLREAARMLSRKDKRLQGILSHQVAVELRSLPDWLGRPGTDAPPALAATLGGAIAFLRLLAAIFFARKDTRTAAEAKTLATRLGKVLEGP
jgi:hypothetical protein